jgi:hypothetical protein
MLYQIASCLNFDQDQLNLAGVFHSMRGAKWDVDGLIFTDEADVFFGRHAYHPFKHVPVLESVVV